MLVAPGSSKLGSTTIGSPRPGTPTIGGPTTLPGPFAPRQLWRVDEALAAADRETGLTFSVYVGDLEGLTREAAERLHAQLGDHAHCTVLMAVSPNQKVLEIVTGSEARRAIPDRVCALAVLSMTAAFEGGDLAGGLVTGLRMLADQARH